VNFYPSPSSSFRQRGFGLLEALVALVLLSSVGFALLAWVHQNLDTAQRLRSFYLEQDARRVALDWLRTVNPMEKPEGEIHYSSLRITWKATPLSQPISQAGYPQGVGRHEMALFNTTISVYRSDDAQPWFTEEFTAIGHRRVGTKTSSPG
jgi:general secretion pathway protein I